MDTPNFLKHWRVPRILFGTVKKNFRRKNVISLLFSIVFFHCKKISERLMGYPTIFWHSETKKFRQKLWYPPIKHNFFHRSFLKKQRVSLQFFLALWAKNFPTQECDTPPLIQNFFPSRILRKNRRVPTQNLSTLWD